MNKTYGDLMAEYGHVRNAARCHSAWDGLDKFVEELIKQIAPKVEVTPTPERHSYDANGSEIHG